MKNLSTTFKKRFSSFSEFYDFYLNEHQNLTCRRLHVFGTTLVLSLIIGAIYWSNFWLLLLLPFAGYGPSWLGHFAFESNRPTTFKYPLQSLLADCLMYWHAITFQLSRKMQEAKAKNSTS